MKTIKQVKEDYINKFDRPSIATMLIFFAVLIFAIAVVLGSIQNTVSMSKTSEESIESYAYSITHQVTSTLQTELTDMKNMLQGIDESIVLFYEDGYKETSSDEYISKYLNRSCSSTRFNYFIFLKEDNSFITGGNVPNDIKDIVSIDFKPIVEAKNNRIANAYVYNNDILYVDPIYLSNGSRLGFIIGGINSSILKQVIDIQVYGDDDNFCIASQSGELLISSNNEKLKEFGGYINSDEKIAKELEDDFNNFNAGLIKANLSDDELYYFSYAPVEGEDWILIILFSNNVFSKAYISYMERSLIIIVCAVLIFMILAALLGLTYRKSRKQLGYLLLTDKLTGGPNINQFSLLYKDLSRKEDVTKYCIVMLDIKEFKLINEAFGFKAGDKVLKDVYDKITKELNENDGEFAARLEMDHYAICLKEDTSQGVQNRINNITEKVNKDINGQDNIYRLEFYQGACFIKDKNQDISLLEENARVARQNMNMDNPNECSFYSEEMYQKIYDNRNLDKLALESIKNHDFKVYYQPKVSMSKHKVKGAEALVRWKHPSKGLIAPYLFVPVLEESGRIKELDKYVFEDVLRWLTERKRANKELFPVSINLSRKHFWKKNFFDDYLAIFNKYDIESKYIIFEITEGVFLDDDKHKRIKDGIAQMHKHGFKCSVDDFGTGYSSLSLIHEMDVDELKFDRSFFTDLNDFKARKIASSLINMASELQLDMVIEGIETDDQLDFLKNQACDIVQGYYYSKPLPEGEFNKWVDDFNKV